MSSLITSWIRASTSEPWLMAKFRFVPSENLGELKTVPSGMVSCPSLNSPLTARCALSSIARTPFTWTLLGCLEPHACDPVRVHASPEPGMDQLLVILPVASVSAT
eukprot:scaffold10960_cov66-Phaeocystis_antarctica.AAC.7